MKWTDPYDEQFPVEKRRVLGSVCDFVPFNPKHPFIYECLFYLDDPTLLHYLLQKWLRFFSVPGSREKTK